MARIPMSLALAPTAGFYFIGKLEPAAFRYTAKGDSGRRAINGGSRGGLAGHAKHNRVVIAHPPLHAKWRWRCE